MKFKKQPKKVFVAERVHKKTARVRVAIELLLVVVVIIGTSFSLVRWNKVSWQGMFEKLKEVVSLKKPVLNTSREATFEERIKETIDEKILNITSLEETSEGNFQIKSSEGVVVIISKDKNLESQSRTLQTLLTKAKIEKKTVSHVDFRFDKLVVRYSQ
ncbi:MAG TPA: hypothetical protein VF303_00930 [Candidatus Nanoarchaeia archaeon]